jgi:RNA polymerase sigma-70 factor (ECF subfamily)
MSASATTLARLVERARDSGASLDERHLAFTSLVQASQHIVFALALSSLRDVEDARDVAQDAFAIAWQRLRQLRDPSAFAAWMRRIVASECVRRRRRARLEAPLAPGASVEADVQRVNYQDVIAAALDRLPEGERHVTVLYYFLGYTLPQIAQLLALKPGTVGKRLHSARLRIRRSLPRSVRDDFVRLGPAQAFADGVRRGLLDEYIGEYRFETRPDHVVWITREGDALIGEAGGQRHILMSGGDQTLLVRHYDGEGRFRRNRRGEVTHFVYYEFGKRLGVARKIGATPCGRDEAGPARPRQQDRDSEA